MSFNTALVQNQTAPQTIKQIEIEDILKQFMLRYLDLVDVVEGHVKMMSMLQEQIVEIKDVLVEAGVAKIVYDH